MAREERVPVLMSEAELKELDDWMDRQRPAVRSRGKAIRSLIERGIKGPSAASTEGSSDLLPVAATPPPGGWDWAGASEAEKDFNVGLPERLIAQFKWLAAYHKHKAKQEAGIVLRSYVESEFRKLAIEP